MKLLISFFILSSVITFSGCTFLRAVVNPHYEKIDTSWIKPGKTTRNEVVNKLGLPPTVLKGRGGIKSDVFRWVTSDTFSATLEAGYIITPTFEMAKERHVHDILIKFDANDKVVLVSHTVVSGEDKKRKIIEWKEVSK